MEEKKSNKFKVIISLVILVVGGYYIYDYLVTQHIVKELFTNYKTVDENKIEIVDSYKSKGHTVYIIKVDNMICEMPVIKSNDGWYASGLSCEGGNPYTSPTNSSSANNYNKIMRTIE